MVTGVSIRAIGFEGAPALQTLLLVCGEVQGKSDVSN